MKKKHYFQLSLIVFLGILGYFVFYENLGMFREVQLTNNHDKQTQVEKRVMDRLEDMTALTNILSKTDEVQSLDPVRIKRILNRIDPNSLGITNMIVFDRQGKIVATLKAPTPALSIVDQKNLQAALRGKTTLSNKFYSPTLKNWLVAFKTPIIADNNKIIGAFSIAITTSQLQIAMQSISFDHQAVPLLVDSSGGVIYYQGCENTKQQKLFRESIFSRFQEAKSGVFEGLSPLNNVETIYEYKQLSDTGWYLAVAQPISAINKMVLLEAINHFIIILFGCIMLYLLYKNYRIQEIKESLEREARLEKMEAIGHLAAGIAHEIRNPLTTIKGFLQLMQANPAKINNKQNIEIMLEEIGQIDAITSEFLCLAKPTAPKLTIYNLNQLLKGLYQIMNSHAIMYNVELKMELAENLPLLAGDPGQSKQVVINLVKNAVEACEDGGKVIVSTTIQDNYVQLNVMDNGQGMPRDMLAKLGTPFLTTKANGTGLGLMVCFSIVHSLGGSLHVESKPQKGTKIIVLLPFEKVSGDKGEI